MLQILISSILLGAAFATCTITNGTLISCSSCPQDLDLSARDLTAIRPSALVACTQIKTISLARNRLSSLPSGFFVGFRQLNSIDLSWNILDELPGDLFVNATHAATGLRSFNAAVNRLTTVPATLFHGPGGAVGKLDLLDLSWNSISSVPPTLLKHTAVTALHFDVNVLSALPPIPAGAEMVSARLNRLETLPYAGENATLPAPKSLDVTGNAFSYIIASDDVSMLPYLDDVSIGDCCGADLRGWYGSALADCGFPVFSKDCDMRFPTPSVTATCTATPRVSRSRSPSQTKRASPSVTASRTPTRRKATATATASKKSTRQTASPTRTRKPSATRSSKAVSVTPVRSPVAKAAALLVKLIFSFKGATFDLLVNEKSATALRISVACAANVTVKAVVLTDSFDRKDDVIITYSKDNNLNKPNATIYDCRVAYNVTRQRLLQELEDSQPLEELQLLSDNGDGDVSLGLAIIVPAAIVNGDAPDLQAAQEKATAIIEALSAALGPTEEDGTMTDTSLLVPYLSSIADDAAAQDIAFDASTLRVSAALAPAAVAGDLDGNEVALLTSAPETAGGSTAGAMIGAACAGAAVLAAVAMAYLRSRRRSKLAVAPLPVEIAAFSTVGIAAEVDAPVTAA